MTARDSPEYKARSGFLGLRRPLLVIHKIKDAFSMSIFIRSNSPSVELDSIGPSSSMVDMIMAPWGTVVKDTWLNGITRVEWLM